MRITLIGSGNVATHLGAALKNAGHQISQVWSRNLQNAALLAYHLKAEPINALDHISNATDLIIIAVKDDAVDDIASFISIKNVLVVHTCGAVGINMLEKYFEKAGVFYPLQTFSKNRELNFREVPLCIESTDKNSTDLLLDVARSISNQVSIVNSAQRKVLHLAAAFACNFPNYLYAAADEILRRENLDFNLLKPLILETALKVQHISPKEAQTGPAARGDEQTMQAHLDLLQHDPDLQQLYVKLSQAIIKMER